VKIDFLKSAMCEHFPYAILITRAVSSISPEPKRERKTLKKCCALAFLACFVGIF
jgi:hypothetical protein